MVRRRLDQEDIEEEVKTSDAKIDADIAKKYPKDKKYSDAEQKDIEAERTKLKAAAQQQILNDADFSYE